jgi:eukaryotic-like serine/threonine-protein kinase
MSEILFKEVGAAPASEDMPTLRWRKSTPPEPTPAETGSLDSLEATALAFKKLCQGQATPDWSLDTWCLSFPGQQEHARLFRDLHRSDPQAADRLAHALLAMPVAGADFLGFRLKAELGRGGLARVYLAQQEDLANRPVVVKVAPDLWGEAHTLAQLQHPHIVPVYSVHRREPFQVVCMPYLGWTTFQDVLHRVQGQPSLPTAGSFLAKVFKAAPAGTNPASSGDLFAQTLAGLSYVEAVVWLCAQLAEGLVHAHEHGIVHHDLKPANILLTDEGQPMLLDFNAAEDTKRAPGTIVAWVAGTLPYMAPEQLAALHGTQAPVDARCDLFAFGVIMFELLTGRYPFQCRNPQMGLISEPLMADRRGAPPRVRIWNAAVTPALEAIVRRCLEPDPTRRYQTARDLQEDLQHQHAHRPLAHMAEPSSKERLRKWVRRHPRTLSAGIIGGFSCIFMIAFCALSLVRGYQLDEWEKQERDRIERQQARNRATAAWEKFQDDMKAAQFLLYTRTNEPEQLAEGITIGMRLVDGYAVLDNPSWQDSTLVQALPPSERLQLGEAMAELLLLLARALYLQHGDAAAGDVLLEKALVMNERAADCSANVAASPALWRQRDDLNAALGREAKAAECRARAEALPLRTAADHYWLASDHIAAGRLREALLLLQKAALDEPQNFWASFVLANCYERLAQDARAEARYGICIALKPSFPWSHFNRGLALLRQQDYRAACADFDTVLKLRPDLNEAYLNRALARQGLQQHREAEEDLTEAIERGGPTRLYFLRARVREKRGDKAGAQADYEEGMRRPPADEKSWLTRGFYLINRDPQAALADFDEALRWNPRSAEALQNKAHVLAEKLGRNEESLQVLNKSLELYPDSVKARGGRGVLLARLGQREAALRDAEDTLRRDASPPRLYQVACIYALTSKERPEDRLQAFQLLSLSLRKGYGFDLLETDTDLDPIRAAPEFRRLVDAAGALRSAPPKSKKV